MPNRSTGTRSTVPSLFLSAFPPPLGDRQSFALSPSQRVAIKSTVERLPTLIHEHSPFTSPTDTIPLTKYFISAAYFPIPYRVLSVPETPDFLLVNRRPAGTIWDSPGRGFLTPGNIRRPRHSDRFFELAELLATCSKFR
jgi:hypothetical protein